MVEYLNAAAAMWWSWMWPVCLQVGFLVLLIGAMDLVLRRNVWPQVRYALWLLVLVKLLLPPTLSLPTSVTSRGYQMVRQAAASQQDGDGVASELDVAAVEVLPASEASKSVADQSVEPVVVAPKDDSALRPSAANGSQRDLARGNAGSPAVALGLSWGSITLLVWMAGAVALTLWLVLRIGRLGGRGAVAGDSEELPKWLRQSLAGAAGELGLRRLPRILLSADVVSPAVYGVFRPVLLLPSGEPGRISRDDARHVLLHELAHIKRGDLWVHAVCVVLQIVYWFNPVLWIVRRKLRHLRELCCDATVAAILRDRTSEYRRTILKAARRTLTRAPEPGLGMLCLFEDSNHLLVRMRWLEKPTWKFRALNRVTVVVAVCLMCACVLPMAEGGRNDRYPPTATEGRMQRNWPGFRGPGGAGVSAYLNVPTTWDGPSGEGIAWKTAVPLPGHSSPIVWEGRLFVSGGNAEALEVYCFEGESGQLLWTGSVPMSNRGKDFEVLEETGYAAPTMVTDGRRVCAIFATGDMGCFDLEGRRLWTRGLGLPKNAYGHASSLAIWRDRVIVQFDQGDRKDGKSRLMALAMDSGNLVWRKDRPVGNSWSSPTVASMGGRDAIITAADPWVIAYDPADGRELWRARCLGGDVASSPYYCQGKVFATEPFEKLVAIDAGGSGDVTASHIAWKTENLGPEVCGLLSDGRQVLTLAGKGILDGYRILDGKRQWQAKFDEEFFASPTLVGDKVYLLGRKGRMFIVEIEKPNAVLSECQLGEDCYASPAFADGRIYIRAEKNLYCIGGSKNVQPEVSRQLERPVVRADASGWVGGRLVRLDGAASDLKGSWSSFRGGRHDGVAQDQGGLAGSWDEGGPPLMWSLEVGQGHAGGAIHDGRVYLVDYDERAKEEVIRCLSLDDGRDIWQYRYPVVIKPNHGITRAVPAVTDEYLVALGPKGHVTCLHPRSGELKWALDPVARFGGKIPPWYSGQCPLIEDGKLVLAVGGDSLLAAIDCRSGELLWSSGNPHRWKMTHSSVMPLEFGGRRQYVYCASDGVVGVDAEDGRILWKFQDWCVKIANVPAPLVVAPGQVFLCGGYKTGSLMIQLRHEAGQFVAEEVFRLAEDVFGAHVQTPILYEEHIYGVRMDGQMVCLDLKGQVMWTSSGNRRFGLGPYLIAGGKIYVMDDMAVLTLAEATSGGYVELARAKLFDGRDAWGAAAAASGRLILRDLRKMVCLDITGQSTSGGDRPE